MTHFASTTAKWLILLMENPVTLGKSSKEKKILQSFADQSVWIVPEVLGFLTEVHLSTDISLFFLFIRLALSDSCCSEENLRAKRKAAVSTE